MNCWGSSERRRVQRIVAATREDVAACKAFYQRVFDWSFDESSMPGYTLIHPGQGPGGGIVPGSRRGRRPSLTAYFLVSDVERTLQRAEAAGARILVPKSYLPNLGTIGQFCDPEGRCIGVFAERDSGT